jgi:biopolymer transport protein ExbD
MPKLKMKRKETWIDMTAMTDVAFLLLTFFMLTAKFRTAEPVTVDLPSSRSELKLPESNVMIISVDKNGRAFFNVDNQKVRVGTLERMSSLYNVDFTQNQLNEFATLESFGVPIRNLPQLLDMDNEKRNSIEQPGIPVDTTGGVKNELSDWIHQARLVDNDLRQRGDIDSKGLRIAVRADGMVNYPHIDRVITTLQDRKINTFNLITTLKGAASAGGTDDEE